MDNLVLSPILDEIKSYFSIFIQISFARVYRDQKSEDDTLSRRDSSWQLIHAYGRNLKIGLWYWYPAFLYLLEGHISSSGHLFLSVLYRFTLLLWMGIMFSKGSDDLFTDLFQ